MLSAQADEMSVKCVAKNLRAIYPKRLRPALDLGSLVI
jgi:hypothetical protein